MRPWKYMTITEVRHMKAMRAAGMQNIEIKAETGRCLRTIARHLGPRPRTSPHPLDKMHRHAERIERLFQSCNRAVSEARP